MREHPAAAQAMQAADAVIFASENTRNLYKDFFHPDNVRRTPFVRTDMPFVRTFYSGIDVPPAARERCSQPLDLDRNFYNVVLVASIEHRKGQDIFIQAYANLPPEIQAKMRCYLIGRHIDHISVYHKYYQKVLKAIRALPDSVRHIQILGELPEPDVHYILSQADLFVLPSRDEVLPVTIIEAMAFARPILTTRVGGISEIIENEVNGLLVDSENPTALRDQMERLVRDPEFGRSLGQQARKTYEYRLTYATFAQQVTQLIDEIRIKAEQD